MLDTFLNLINKVLEVLFLFHSCSYICLIFCVVFSPADNQWSVSKMMNSEDMKQKEQYSKLLFNHLSEGRRQYQMMEERVVPEESSVTQIMKVKQQVKEEVCVCLF